MSSSKQAMRVVVGVDGAAGGRAALSWAVAYARAAGASLDLVHVYDPEADEVYGGLYPSEEARLLQDARESQVLAAAERELAGTVPVLLHLRRGGAGRALVEQSGGADLLVVGATSHRRLVRALLGSTADYCLRRAECPVVIVPAAGGAARVPQAQAHASAGPLL